MSKEKYFVVAEFEEFDTLKQAVEAIEDRLYHGDWCAENEGEDILIRGTEVPVKPTVIVLSD